SKGSMIDDLVAGSVETMSQRSLGDRHPDCVGAALTERTGRRFDARSDAELRMAGRAAPPLTKCLQILQGQVVSGQMQEAVEKHASMPGGEHKAVAVGPFGVARVVLQVPLPQNVSHRGRA